MRNNKYIPVYGEPYDKIEVKSSISPTRTYSIRFGEVTWSDSIGTVLSIYIVVEYNGIPQMYERPIIPHYLLEPDENGVSDFVKVHKAMEEIARRNKLM